MRYLSTPLSDGTGRPSCRRSSATRHRWHVLATEGVLDSVPDSDASSTDSAQPSGPPPLARKQQ
eukprot:11157082-Lingulodinium_polyedra.AAC.1